MDSAGSRSRRSFATAARELQEQPRERRARGLTSKIFCPYVWVNSLLNSSCQRRRHCRARRRRRRAGKHHNGRPLRTSPSAESSGAICSTYMSASTSCASKRPTSARAAGAGRAATSAAPDQLATVFQPRVVPVERRQLRRRTRVSSAKVTEKKRVKASQTPRQHGWRSGRVCVARARTSARAHTSAPASSAASQRRI